MRELVEVPEGTVPVFLTPRLLHVALGDTEASEPEVNEVNDLFRAALEEVRGQ